MEEDLREIKVKVEYGYHTILNTKSMFDRFKNNHDFIKVKYYQKEVMKLAEELKELKGNLKSENFERFFEIENRIGLLESYIQMFFLIQSIKEISCENN